MSKCDAGDAGEIIMETLETLEEMLCKRCVS